MITRALKNIFLTLVLMGVSPAWAKTTHLAKNASASKASQVKQQSPVAQGSAESVTPTQSATPTNNQQQSFQAMAEEEKIAELYRQLLESSQRVTSILSKIQLMIHGGTIKITDVTFKHFKNTVLKSIVDTHKKNIGVLTTPNKKNLPEALRFIMSLTDYLAGLVNKGIDKAGPFTFKSQKSPASVSDDKIRAQLKQLEKKVGTLETALSEFGMDWRQKTWKRLCQFDKKNGISHKLWVLSLGVAVASTLRLMFKKDGVEREYLLRQSALQQGSMPQEEHDRLLASLQEQPVGQSDDGQGQLPQIPVSSLSAFERSLISWFSKGENIWNFWDKHIIGTPPLLHNNLGFGGLINLALAQGFKHPGHGFLGKTFEWSAPGFALLTAASFLKDKVDLSSSAVANWRALAKDPKRFFRLDEMLLGKKQNMSAAEENYLLKSTVERAMPTITFDDLAGLEDQKKELEPIVHYLLNPELFEKTGTTIERGFLLYGPTRTGKTYLAEALAGELVLKHGKDLAFLKVKGNELGGLLQGGIKDVLDLVKKFAPCIVFIDELDLLNLQRDANSKLLCEFLTCMKTDDSQRQVIFLAATNRIDHIDHSLLQPGRFGKIISFENPSHLDRKDFFKKKLTSRMGSVPSTINLDILAVETETCTYGDLSSIVDHAITLHINNKEVLSHAHFEDAIDTFKYKIAGSIVTLPADEKRLIAVHLASHAVAYLTLPINEIIHKVTMLPIQKPIKEEKIWLSDQLGSKKITTFGNVFTLHKMNTAGFDLPEQRRNKVKALLAGHVGEKLIFGSCTYNYHPEDTDQARQLVEGMVLRGLKKESLPKEYAQEKLAEVMKIMDQCEQEVTKLLEPHKDLILTIAAILSENLTLSLNDLLTIVAEYQKTHSKPQTASASGQQLQPVVPDNTDKQTPAIVVETPAQELKPAVTVDTATQEFKQEALEAVAHGQPFLPTSQEDKPLPEESSANNIDASMVAETQVPMPDVNTATETYVPTTDANTDTVKKTATDIEPENDLR